MRSIEVHMTKPHHQLMCFHLFQQVCLLTTQLLNFSGQLSNLCVRACQVLWTYNKEICTCAHENQITIAAKENLIWCLEWDFNSAFRVNNLPTELPKHHSRPSSNLRLHLNVQNFDKNGEKNLALGDSWVKNSPLPRSTNPTNVCT